MSSRMLSVALFAFVALLPTLPASAAVILITQASILNGGITPGDTPGFPATLTRPGAYRLDSDIIVPGGRIGIRVESHYVDIDMNGFRLYGFNTANVKVGEYGVISTFGIGRIHGGIITGFKYNGIKLTGNSNAWIVEDMHIQYNGGDGIDAFASGYSRFLKNLIIINGNNGVTCAYYCHFEGNTISDNEGYGISLQSGTVLGNSLFSNALAGIIDYEGSADTGFGNNTIIGNNAGISGTQVYNLLPLQPNTCRPTAC